MIRSDTTSRAYGNSTLGQKLAITRFRSSGAAPEDLKRVIGSFCPGVLFPYAREAVSDLISKGGFPSFLLPLVNFAALYAQAASTAPAATNLVN